MAEQTMAYLLGASVWAGLIIGFGPQNVFVLQQGMRGGGWLVAAICTVCDLVLGAFGLWTVSGFVESGGYDIRPIAALGACPLLYYGVQALRNSFSGTFERAAEQEESHVNPVLGALAFSLLNPYVYIDTIIVLGGIGSALPAEERLGFFSGVMTVSVFWFFGLTAFGGWLSGTLSSSRAYRAVEAMLAALCLCSAAQLLVRAL